MADRCELTELLTDQCGHCRKSVSIEDEVKATRARLLDNDWFTAQFAGTCAGCGERFLPGTAITCAEYGWTAECCAKEGRC